MEDLTEGKTSEAMLLWRGLFLVGEYDQTGATVNEILAKTDLHERFYLMLGRLGELVGEDQAPQAITMGSVIAVAEDLP